MARFFSVHVPAWDNDSHVGDYDTLPEAIAATHDGDVVSRSECVIYDCRFFSLPFGWRLERRSLVRLL